MGIWEAADFWIGGVTDSLPLSVALSWRDELSFGTARFSPTSPPPHAGGERPAFSSRLARGVRHLDLLP